MTDAVSRETPPAPAVAVGVFSAALPLAERFASILAGDGVERGLLGPREVPRLWERHLLNCAVVADAVPPRVALCDVGSGAGLPGLVIGLTRPDLDVTLVEPLLRRSTFLEEVVAELALPNVTVLRARAEQLHGTRHFDFVTARAVAPLGRLARWCLPLVADGGALLAMKGASAETEVAESAAELRALHAGPISVERYGADVLEVPATVVRIGSSPSPGSRAGTRRRPGRLAARSEEEAE